MKTFLIIGLCLLLIFSNTALFSFIVKKWEVAPVAPQHFKGKYEYAIVLGGMASVAANGKLYIGPAFDRIMTAIILYKKGQIKKIVITGGSGMLIDQEKREAPLLETFCIQMGIPEEDLIIEQESRNTYENALFTKQKIGLPEEKTLLITSAFHMRRSIGCFKKQGFSFDVLSSDPLGEPVIYFDDYFVPKAEPLMKWDYLIKEWIGYYAYKWVGYVD